MTPWQEEELRAARDVRARAEKVLERSHIAEMDRDIALARAEKAEIDLGHAARAIEVWRRELTAALARAETAEAHFAAVSDKLAKFASKYFAIYAAAQAVVTDWDDLGPVIIQARIDTLRAALASKAPHEHPDLRGLRRAEELLPMTQQGDIRIAKAIRAEIARLEGTKP